MKPGLSPGPFRMHQNHSHLIKKRIMLLMVITIGPLLQLSAQSTDPELAERLKSVMSLFEKNQQALKDELAELAESNRALTQANLNLFKDLQTAEKRIESLETENLLLRSKISEVAISELESAALHPDRVASANRPAPSASIPEVVVRSPVEEDPSNQPAEDLININTATLEELTKLPLIDEAMAEQIISNRPYNIIEDLIINQTFGPTKLRAVAPFVTTE